MIICMTKMDVEALLKHGHIQVDAFEGDKVADMIAAKGDSLFEAKLILVRYEWNDRDKSDHPVEEPQVPYPGERP